MTQLRKAKAQTDAESAKIRAEIAARTARDRARNRVVRSIIGVWLHSESLPAPYFSATAEKRHPKLLRRTVRAENLAVDVYVCIADVREP
jgi:hypothetical protein